MECGEGGGGSRFVCVPEGLPAVQRPRDGRGSVLPCSTRQGDHFGAGFTG